MLKTLQTYRGLAAISVAAFHLSTLLADPRYLGVPVLKSLTWKMNLGVDFFFVLSGFIILMAHERDLGQPNKLGSFIKKRFVRIYPTYWIYVSVFCVLLFFGLGTQAVLPDTQSQWFTTYSLIRGDSFPFTLAPAWTLVHEIAFYVVFAAAIVNRKIGVLIFTLWFVLIIIYFDYPVGEQKTAFATYFAAYNLDFGIGMLAYCVFTRWRHLKPIYLLASGLTLFSITFWNEAQGINSLVFPLFYALSFGLIITASAIWEVSVSNLKLYILPFLGDASYSIYLTHENIEGLVAKVFVRLQQIIYFPNQLLFLLIWSITIALGCLAYSLVERPATRWTKRLVFANRS